MFVSSITYLLEEIDPMMSLLLCEALTHNCDFDAEPSRDGE